MPVLALESTAPVSMSTSSAATEVVPRSTTSPATGAVSFAGSTSITLMASPSRSITQRTSKSLSRSTRASARSA